MGRTVAVIDIGKTNKKVAIYDAALNQLEHVQEAFSAAPGPDGILHEPVAAIWTWLKRQLRELHARHGFDAISVATHGATIACLDCDGELALPVVAYDHGLDDKAQQALDAGFYRLCGDPLELQAETGTCDLPLLINAAKAIYFYKSYYPDGLARTTSIVNYPQYWAHLLTGRIAAEPTFTFNHSYLHNIRTRGPSRAAQALGVADLVARRFVSPWHVVGRLHGRLQAELGLPPVRVVAGIHDSNAALLPYLVKHASRDFVLNSTGTWCVAMHAVDGVTYAPEELGRKIIFNVDALGGFQKTSFLMGGQEYDHYHGLIGGEHGSFDAARVNEALAAVDQAFVPGAFPSQFPAVSGGAVAGDEQFSLSDLADGRRPAWFADPTRAHDLLNASLAIQTTVALEATGVNPGTTIFVEGGFRNNPSYLAMLSALYPNQRVVCTSLEQATAVGAALLGWSALDNCAPTAFADRFTISEREVATPDLPNLQAYTEAFLKRAAG